MPIYQDTTRYYQHSNRKHYENNVLDQLKEYIEEVDDRMPENKVVVIDIDQAKDVSSHNSRKNLLKRNVFVKKINSITSQHKKNKTPIMDYGGDHRNDPSETVLRSNNYSISSNKGHQVDQMVKKLSRDVASPPPIPSVMVTPTPYVQHNNNQPFSYTRGLSPEKLGLSTEKLTFTTEKLGFTTEKLGFTTEKLNNNNNNSNNNGTNGRHHPRDSFDSDSYDSVIDNQDSYLGEKYLPESPIRPKYTQKTQKCEETKTTVNARRDLLESRIHDITNKYNYYTLEKSPKITVNHRRIPHETILSKSKTLYKSTPDILHPRKNAEKSTQYKSYHDSLKRTKTDQEKQQQQEGDSGLENDIPDSLKKKSPSRNNNREYYRQDESVDEGFESSLFSTEKSKDISEILSKSGKKIEYDSDKENRKNSYVYSKIVKQSDEDENLEELDYEKRNYPLRKQLGPGTPEKTPHGLEKVKNFFNLGNNKKTSPKQQFVREESLRNRYIEYRGEAGENDDKYNKEKKIDSSTLTRNKNGRIASSTPEKPPRSPHPLVNWFKSLDRSSISRQKNKKLEKKNVELSNSHKAPPPVKTLRFFGDTDLESSDSTTFRKKTPQIGRPVKLKSQSLHEINYPNSTLTNHKSLNDVSKRPPRPMKHDDNQQKIYLHEATVGDIPRSEGSSRIINGGPGFKDDFTPSNARFQKKKALSRSFSVLAPWKPQLRNDKRGEAPTLRKKPTNNKSLNRNYTKKEQKSPPKRSISFSHKKQPSDALKNNPPPSGNISKHYKSESVLDKYGTSDTNRGKARRSKDRASRRPQPQRNEDWFNSY